MVVFFGGVAMLVSCGTNPASSNTPFSPAAPVVSGNTPDGSVPPLPIIAEPMHTILAGTRVVVRNTGAIRADAAAVGQTFHAVLIANVVGEDSKVAIPRGSEAMLVVRAAKGQGEEKGRSELTLDLDSVTVEGRRYRLETRDIVEQGRQGLDRNKRSAKFVGGGALLGTIVSAVPGGGKDAVIGPASGTGAGTAAQAVAHGSSISIPAESILTFQLEARVEVQPE
jgi:hypothetical protein